jgi:transcriptional regulator with XRE-family HTH domain
MASTKENDRGAQRTPMELRIAANLAKFVEQSGYTQNQLADMAGIPQATLGRYMRGESAIPSEALLAIAPVLGRSVDHFGMANPPPPPTDLSETAPVWLKARPDVDLTAEDLAAWEKFLAGVRERRAKKGVSSPKKK